MEGFQRSFYSLRGEAEHNRQVQLLQNNPGFAYLKEDVLQGTVYPALRTNTVDFYYAGARLCRYTGGRMEWHKEAASPQSRESYGSIKEACQDWGVRKDGIPNERSALSCLYRSFSPYLPDTGRLVLLDIEVGFPRLRTRKGKTCDNVQVDLLFLDTKAGTLCFVEAKEAADSRIKAKPAANASKNELYNRLEVAGQINKYRLNLAQRESEILSAYTGYLGIMQRIFQCTLPSGALKLYPRPKLLVYGKSRTQNGLACLDALHSVLGDDLIQLDRVPELSEAHIIR